MKILTMMVLGPGYLVRALFLFFKFLFIVFVDCQVMESQNLVIVSVEYFQLVKSQKYFPAQNIW